LLSVGLFVETKSPFRSQTAKAVFGDKAVHLFNGQNHRFSQKVDMPGQAVF
jgi:hypothetical protein